MAIAVAGVVALAACDEGSVGRSRGETTTPAASGRPVAVSEIESLVVPLDQIPGVGDSLNRSDSTAEKQPSTTPSSSDNETHSGDCAFASLSIGDEKIFGRNSIAFRGVHYSGFSNVYVEQAIGVYANKAEASAVFKRLADKVNTCKPASGDMTVDSIAPSSASWHVRGFSPVKGTDETSRAGEDRTIGNVVFRVAVGHFDNSSQIAASVADLIAAKINKRT